VTATTRTLQHQAFFYRSAVQLHDGVTAFVEEGLEEGEPAMVALPEPALSQVRRRLERQSAPARLFDMRELGRNPARIISAIGDFVDGHPGRRTRMVGEPIWRGRTTRETAEATRHEALINLAFAHCDVTILCPYDLSLADDVLACSHRTHPELIRDGACSASGDYAAERIAALDADPLPPAPDGAAVLREAVDLGGLRRWLQPQLASSGLPADRADDLTVAVNEAAGNAILHGGGPPDVRFWHEPGRVVCEVADAGWIRDPLAGRRRPVLGSVNGRGLWLANQLCDLTQLRSNAGGTVLRLHMVVPG
jgi:anti-sigma regulatory factor (Ser/Thr protein kinase)